MNIKKLGIAVLTLLSLMASLPSNAALSVDQSRYIFEGNKDAISIVVDNASKSTYGGQAWIENIKETDSRPTFVLTPPFFKISGNGKQVLRVIKALELMPEDSESIYWISLQEIPPKNKDGGLSVALRTKVKLLYRPEGLVEGRKNAEKNLSIKHVGGKSQLFNSTPYIFAIADVLDEKDKKVNLSQAQSEKLAMFMPGDFIEIPKGIMVKKVVSIDDFGHLGTHEITGKVENKEVSNPHK